MTRTVSLSRPGRRLAGTALAATIALTLSACGTMQAGAAAVVGGRRISVDELQKATADIQTYAGSQQTVNQDKVLLFMALSPYLVRAASDAGVAVSEDTARQDLKAHHVDQPSQGALDAIRGLDALNNLQQGGKQQALVDFAKLIRSTKIEVNPRYGKFDPTNLDIVATAPDWLVSTAAPSAGAGTGGSGNGSGNGSGDGSGTGGTGSGDGSGSAPSATATP